MFRAILVSIEIWQQFKQEKNDRLISSYSLQLVLDSLGDNCKIHHISKRKFYIGRRSIRSAAYDEVAVFEPSDVPF